MYFTWISHGFRYPGEPAGLRNGGPENRPRAPKKLGENTQLYQIIDIKENELRFRSYDATGELYDEFLIQKQAGKPNLLVEK